MMIRAVVTALPSWNAPLLDLHCTEGSSRGASAIPLGGCRLYHPAAEKGCSRKVTYLQWVARQPPAGPLHTCPPRLSANHWLSARVVPGPSRIRAGAPKVREPHSNRARRPGPSESQTQRPALHGLVDRILLPLRELPGRES